MKAKVWISVSEYADKIGRTTTYIYTLIERKELKTKKINGLIKVKVEGVKNIDEANYQICKYIGEDNIMIVKNCISKKDAEKLAATMNIKERYAFITYRIELQPNRLRNKKEV